MHPLRPTVCRIAHTPGRAQPSGVSAWSVPWLILELPEVPTFRLDCSSPRQGQAGMLGSSTQFNPTRAASGRGVHTASGGGGRG
jgi:hypothetical protein